MEYSIDVENVKREVADQHYKAKVVYTFTISNGLAKTHADVVLTEAGAEASVLSESLTLEVCAFCNSKSL